MRPMRNSQRKAITMKSNKKSGLVVKSNVKAGGSFVNHNRVLLG